MNDEQIIEYLRSRGRATPPLDLTATVMNAVDVAPLSRSWFVAVVPATAAVIAAGAVLVVALLIGQRPDVGPAPAGSDKLAPSATEAVSASPAPTSLAPTSAPSPPPDYVRVDGAPFTVLENVEADAVMARPDQCVNPDAGYAVSFPDDWYTNTATGDVAACSWFTPQPFAVSTPGIPPGDVWITIGEVDGMVGYTSLTEVFHGNEITLSGRAGHRAEYNPDTAGKPEFRAYQYVISLGEGGPTLVAATNTEMAADYELAKAVLDRIMASFVFDDE